MKPAYWEQACLELAGADPVLAELIGRYPGMSLVSRGDAFHTLARSIVGQQISVKAADSVWRRFEAALGEIDSGRILATSTETLRGCGLSARKVEYLCDLASHHQAGRLDPAQWQNWADEAIIDELTLIEIIRHGLPIGFQITELLRCLCQILGQSIFMPTTLLH